MRNDDFCELGVVKTATPCSEPWEKMQGDEVKRFCAKCNLHVYDFAALTADEARELLIETEGRLCGRIFTRADGTVLTKDCPTGVARQRRKRVAGVAAAAALLSGAAVVMAGAPKEQSCGLDAARLTQADDLAAVEPKTPLVHPRPLPSGNAPETHVLGGMMRPSTEHLAALKKQKQQRARR